MSQLVEIEPGTALGWLTLDHEEHGIYAASIVPTYGPLHRYGMDCWCHPTLDWPLIIHNVAQ